jgi:hypothetical protein
MRIHRFLTGIALGGIFTVTASISAGSEVLKVAFPPPVSAAPQAEDPGLSGLRIIVDFAAILHVEGGMSVVAVGNPAIADASLVNHQTVLVTGHLSGTTNVIAMDDTGRILADVQVYVSAQKPGMVRVQRGTQVEVHNCISGLCEAGPNQAVSTATPAVMPAAPAAPAGG